MEFDKSIRPFQTIYELIKIRNLLAHGRTETITAENETEPIQTKWQSKCNKKDIEKYLIDLEKVIRKIHKISFKDDICEDDPFLILEIGFAE